MTRRTSRRILASRPFARLLSPPPLDPVQALLTEAVRAHQAARYDEARQLCLDILARDVRHAEALHLLGLVLYSTGRADTAVGMFQRAIAVNEREAAYHSNLGNALHATGSFDEALAAYGQAIALKPTYADAHYNRANTLRDQGLPDEAIAAYQHALRLNPDFAEAHCNLGGLLRNCGRLSEAEEHLRAGLRLRPDYADSTNNLAVTLQDLGRLDESMACFERAVELAPDNAEVEYNRALTHLVAGDFANGWRLQEARWKTPKAPRAMDKPQWKGEPLHGQRLLLHHECGFGDTIQFLRYVPLVAARGATVLLDVPRNLVRLAEWIPGVAGISVTGEPLPAFDLHCPMMSLPLAFGTELETIPAQVPYLQIPHEAVAQAAALEWPQRELRVGLAWSGNPAFPRDQFRSVTLSALAPLLAVPGALFYSLQMGPAAAQLEPYRDRVADLTPHIRDLADTAALLENLDLLITVDTAVAHLAGALGLPVWTMIPASPDWRWLTERRDSPWYPSMRLFRQQTLGAWEPVVESLRVDLASACRRAERLMAQAAQA